MEFHVKPVLQQISELYDLPRGQERFKRYLFMLQGHTKGEMVLPIGGYNPMGKELFQQRISELINMDAEAMIEAHLEAINAEWSKHLSDKSYQIVINVSDDLGGAWTDRFASDYSNTFDFGAIAKRNFCTPYFWTSDPIYSKELVLDRLYMAVFRTIHFSKNGKPRTLGEHLRQEIFAAQLISEKQKQNSDGLEAARKFYELHKNAEDYNLIFNFFYGDEASSNLGYQTYGNPAYTGFKLAYSNLIGH